jgi:hypothetical protein
MTYSTVWFGFWVADEFKPGVDTSHEAKTRIAQTLGLTHFAVVPPFIDPHFPCRFEAAPGTNAVLFDEPWFGSSLNAAIARGGEVSNSSSVGPDCAKRGPRGFLCVKSRCCLVDREETLDRRLRLEPRHVQFGDRQQALPNMQCPVGASAHLPSEKGLAPWPVAKKRAITCNSVALAATILGERGAQSMDFLNSKDVSLLTYYESIRQQVDADRHSQHRFTGGAVKQYAEKLRAEMDRRRLSYKPIDWS